MASAVSTSSFVDNHKVTVYDHDPADSTVATDVAWVDMADYGEFTVIAFASALTGNGVTAFKILANSQSDGGGTDAEIKVHAVGSAPDAVGDYLVLSCTAEEIRQAESSATGRLRYVSANLDCDNTADENVVVYIRSKPRFPQRGLTADVVA